MGLESGFKQSRRREADVVTAATWETGSACEVPVLRVRTA
jgi:hypothetical protein